VLGFSDRSVIAGLSVIALSIGVSALFLGHGRHRPLEQEWSSRQRASIATGTVRGEASRAIVTAPPSAADATRSDDEAAHAADSTSQEPVASPPPKHTAHARTTRHAPSSRPATLAKAKANGRYAESEASSSIAPAASTRAPRSLDKTPDQTLDKTPDQNAGLAAPGKDSKPQIVNEPMRAEAAPPPDTRVHASESKADAPQPQTAASTPKPKTRKDVQDELRKARASGALPRFGNPDPYGPGGAPSNPNE
jgi:hypothetical protein